ncbi:MAG: FliH/SctL family protein [Ferrimonas sp.]
MSMIDPRTLAYLNNQVKDWKLQDFDQPEGSVEAADDELVMSLPTLEELEAIQQQAWQEGYDEGKQQGHEDGLKEGRLKGAEVGLQDGLEQGRSEGIAAGVEEIQQRCQRLDEIIAQLQAPLQAMDEQMERELVTLAMKLAQAVVQVELAQSPQAVLQALHVGVGALPQQRQSITIQANAEDLALIEQSYGAEELAKRDWQLQLEPSLSTGSLEVVTERSQVPVLADDRLRRVLENFAAKPRPDVLEPDYAVLGSAPVDTDALTAQAQTLQANRLAEEAQFDQVEATLGAEEAEIEGEALMPREAPESHVEPDAVVAEALSEAETAALAESLAGTSTVSDAEKEALADIVHEEPAATQTTAHAELEAEEYTGLSTESLAELDPAAIDAAADAVIAAQSAPLDDATTSDEVSGAETLNRPHAPDA